MTTKYPAELRRRKTVRWSEAALLLELDDVGFAEWLRDEFATRDSDARLLPFVDVRYPGISARVIPGFATPGGYRLWDRSCEFWRSLGPVPLLKRPSLGARLIPEGIFPPEGDQCRVQWRKQEQPDASRVLDVMLTGRLFLTPETVKGALSNGLAFETVFAAPLEWQRAEPVWPLLFAFEPSGGFPRGLCDEGIRFALGDVLRARAKIDGRRIEPSDTDHSEGNRRTQAFDREREQLHLLICGLIELARRTGAVPLHNIRAELAKQFEGRPDVKLSSSTVRNVIDLAVDSAKKRGLDLAQVRRKNRK